MTSDGMNSYSWDSRNRLTSIGTSASFVYDGVNRRQSITQGSSTITTVFDRHNPIQEQSVAGTTVLANLLTGLGIDERFTRTEGSTTTDYLTDLLNSAAALTNTAGTPSITTSYGYDPYGVTTATGTTSDNTYQYTGRVNDSTGLYYNNARYYNPAWGRFISEDPIGLSAGPNIYAYVGGDPVSSADNSGLDTVVIVGLPTNGGGGSSNPFGHASIGFTGQGAYSYGTSGYNFGSSLTDFLAWQATYRTSIAFIIPTTPQQEQQMVQYLQNNYAPGTGPYNATSHNCSTAVTEALLAGGVNELIYIEEALGGGMIMGNTPTDVELIANTATGVQSYYLPQGAGIPAIFNNFNPTAK